MKATTTEPERTAATDACPECSDGGDVVRDGREQICEQCGLVLDADRVDHGPEWRTFDNGDSSGFQRCNGGPDTETHHRNGHGSVLFGLTDANGNRVTGRQVAQLNRMKRHQKRTNTRTEQNCRFAMGEIRRLAGTLDVPKTTRDRAARLFKQAHGEGLVLGRTIEGFVGAAVYAACRCDGVVRTFGEVAESSTVGPKRIRLAYDAMNRELELPIPLVRPHDLVPRIAAEVGVGSTKWLRAADVAMAAEEAGIANGKNPAGVAAAALYEVTGYRATQERLAEAADVTAPTLRSTWQAMQDAGLTEE